MKIAKRVLVLVVGLVLAFALLAPIVPDRYLPPLTYFCPINGCHFSVYGSITYMLWGFGGLLTIGHGIQVSYVFCFHVSECYSIIAVR